MDSPLATKIKAANASLLAEGNTAEVPEFFSPEYVAHFTGQDMSGGHAAIAQVVRAYRRAFPDLQVEVEILVEAADRIAWQRTLRGTQNGSFQGFPATGLPVVWRDMVTSCFRDGVIVEEWVVTDLAERLLLARKSR